jgi:hypothetical protein
MEKQGKVAAIVVGVMCLFVVFLVAVDPLGVMSADGEADEEEEVTYDLYRPYGDIYCHLGDTVTFSAEVIDYYDAETIGDEGLPEETEEEATEEEATEEETTEEETAEEIDYSQFQFQWYYCQHIPETGEIVYVPIEGANEPTYTIDHVTEADLYDNGELEYLLAMFPADETDLSYGNRINISSIWFCLSEVPDFVDANEAISCTCDPEGEASQNDYVAFSTYEAGDFEISIDNVSDPDATVSAYIATLDHGMVVAEDEPDLDEPYTLSTDPAYTYVISFYTDSDETVTFDYTITGEQGEGYEFSASDLEPNDAGLNVYVDEISIRSDGEYQITVENPWVDADYTSSDEDVATVSDDGKIWAVAPGETTVTVTQGDESCDILVTVV